MPKMRSLALLALVIGIFFLSGAAVWASEFDDALGDSETFQFVSAGVGAVLFQGDAGDLYDSGVTFNARLGCRLTEHVSIVPAVSMAIIQEKGGGEGKLFYDITSNGVVRFAKVESPLIPYLQFGVGLTGLDGPDLQLGGGLGLDWRAWNAGTLGVLGLFRHVPYQSSSFIPIYLTFSHFY